MVYAHVMCVCLSVRYGCAGIQAGQPRAPDSWN